MSQYDDLDKAIQAVGTSVNGRLSDLDGRVTTLSNTVSNFALVRGLFNALTAGASGTNNAVNVKAQEMVLKDGAGHIVVLANVNVTGSSAAAGTPGAGKNSLDTGNWASATWYAKYVIYNEKTQETALIFSLNSTAPALPPDFTFYTRVGWMRTEAASSCRPMGYTQKGAQVRYLVNSAGNTPTLPVLGQGKAGDVTIPTWVPLNWTNLAPPTTVSLGVLVASTGNACTTIAAPNPSYGAWTSYINPPPIMWSNVGTYVYSIQEMMVESNSIYWASNPGAQPPDPNGTGNNGVLMIAGWTDNL